ncbi:hypothetical protein J2747_000767 [Thermococcus stetteri]|nr:hypothetical protein [Thermococcus stetteri]
MNLKLEGVYPNGKLVWSQNISSEAVRVINPQVSLGPTNVERSITIVIALDKELADSYFGKPVFDSYLNKLAGRVFTITATIDGMGEPVTGTFSVKKLGYWNLFKETLLYLFILGIGVVFAFGPTWGHPLGAGIFSFGLVVYLAKMASELQWILRYGGSPDFVFFVLLLPLVVLTAFLIVKNPSGRTIGLLLWFGFLMASKNLDNGCIMAFIFSITLWTLVEAHLFSIGFYEVSRGTLFEMGTLFSCFRMQSL